MTQFTKTESAMIKLLSDGKEHSKQEMVDCLPDEFSNNIHNHVHNIRQKIRPNGREIVVLYKGKIRPVCYQLVQLIRVAVN